MRREPTRPSSKPRGKAPRARRCDPRPTAQPRRAATDEKHACRIVKLRAQKRQLTERLDRVNKMLDAAFLAARQDKTLYSVVGQAVQAAEGRPQTAEDLARVERELRKLTHHARRRRVPGGNEARVAARHKRPETGGMRKPQPIFVRESYYSPDHLPPDVAPPRVDDEDADEPALGGPELVGDDGDDEDENEDEDEDDQE